VVKVFLEVVLEHAESLDVLVYLPFLPITSALMKEIPDIREKLVPLLVRLSCMEVYNGTLQYNSSGGSKRLIHYLYEALLSNSDSAAVTEFASLRQVHLQSLQTYITPVPTSCHLTKEEDGDKIYDMNLSKFWCQLFEHLCAHQQHVISHVLKTTLSLLEKGITQKTTEQESMHGVTSDVGNEFVEELKLLLRPFPELLPLVSLLCWDTYRTGNFDRLQQVTGDLFSSLPHLRDTTPSSKRVIVDYCTYLQYQLRKATFCRHFTESIESKVNIVQGKVRELENCQPLQRNEKQIPPEKQSLSVTNVLHAFVKEEASVLSVLSSLQPTISWEHYEKDLFALFSPSVGDGWDTLQAKSEEKYTLLAVRLHEILITSRERSYDLVLNHSDITQELQVCLSRSYFILFLNYGDDLVCYSM